MNFLSTVKVFSLATTALAFSALPNLAESLSKLPVTNSTQIAQSSPITFRDVNGNVYQAEIEQAVSLGIVKGFPDGSYKPSRTVSREQAAVMIVQAINSKIPVDLDEKPSNRRLRPFLDVPKDRWSAKYINWLQWNLYPANASQLTGNFRPEDPITRIELVDFIRRTAEAMRSKISQTAELQETEKPIVFSDVSGYDKVLTMQMSAYCRVASPRNERGNAFYPTRQARRDYTAAAIVRALNCE